MKGAHIKWENVWFGVIRGTIGRRLTKGYHPPWASNIPNGSHHQVITLLKPYSLISLLILMSICFSQEEEHINSMVIFFVLTMLLLCIFLVHFLIRFKMNVLPESIAVIFLGAVVGLFLKILSNNDVLDLEVNFKAELLHFGCCSSRSLFRKQKLSTPPSFSFCSFPRSYSRPATHYTKATSSRTSGPYWFWQFLELRFLPS